MYNLISSATFKIPTSKKSYLLFLNLIIQNVSIFFMIVVCFCPRTLWRLIPYVLWWWSLFNLPVCPSQVACHSVSGTYEVHTAWYTKLCHMWLGNHWSLLGRHHHHACYNHFSNNTRCNDQHRDGGRVYRNNPCSTHHHHWYDYQPIWKRWNIFCS